MTLTLVAVAVFVRKSPSSQLNSLICTSSRPVAIPYKLFQWLTA